MADEKEVSTAKAVQEYILKPGKSFDGIAPGGHRRVYEPGEAVPLNEGQYTAFKDRFVKTRSEYDDAVAEHADSDEVEPAEPLPTDKPVEGGTVPQNPPPPEHEPDKGGASTPTPSASSTPAPAPAKK